MRFDVCIHVLLFELWIEQLIYPMLRGFFTELTLFKGAIALPRVFEVVCFYPYICIEELQSVVIRYKFQT